MVETIKTMPALFVAHGAPTFAFEDNVYTRTWKELGKTLPKPKAILSISAHWLTKGTQVTGQKAPPTIHDFYNFPKEYYNVQYPCKGNPELAADIAETLKGFSVTVSEDWGLDHGTWTYLLHMYPNADIPVLQLSIDETQPAQHHYDLGKALGYLRKKGVLVLGGGVLVHNLRAIDFHNPDNVFDWARNAHEIFKKCILSGDHKALIDYKSLGKDVQMAIPTPDHYAPLLYILGMQETTDKVSLFCDSISNGSMSMLSMRLDSAV